MATIGNLAVMLSANASGLVKGLDQGKSALAGFAKAAAAVAAGTLLADAVTSGVAALKDWTTQAFGTIDTAFDLSDRFGLTTEALIGFQHAADQSGASAEDFNGAVEKMLNALGELQGGSEDARKKFERLGFDVGALADMDTESAILEIADKIAAIDSPARQAAAAMDIFGKSGQKMVLFLREGREGLLKFREEATALGLTFTGAQAEGVNKMLDTWDKFKKLLVGVGTQIAIFVAPLFDELLNNLVESAAAGEGWGAKIRSAIESVVLYLAKALDGVKQFGIGLLEMLVVAERAVNLLKVGSEFGGAVDRQQTLDQIDDLMKGRERIKKQLAEGQIDQNFFDHLDSVFTQQIRDLNKKAIGQAVNFENPLEDLLNQFKAGGGKFEDQAQAFINRMREMAGAGAQEQAAVAGAAKKAAEDRKAAAEAARIGAVADDVGKLTASLQEQIDTFGLSADAIERWKLAQKGATAAHLEEVEALQKQLGKLKEFQTVQERLGKIAEDRKPPEQKFQEELDKLFPMMDQGKLKADELQALLKQKAGELGLGKLQEIPGLKAGPELIDRGSAAAISAQTRFEKQGMGDHLVADPLEKLVKEAIETKKIQKRQEEFLKRLVEKIDKAPVLEEGDL